MSHYIQGMRALIPFVFALPTIAQAACLDDAMLVFDGSHSMAVAELGSTAPPKIVEARQAIAQVAPDAAAQRRLGLVSYGHDGPTDCFSVQLHFTPRFDAGPDIMAAINAIEPDGSTPLTAAVEVAVDALGESGGTIVLVTDGAETCNGDPCGLARSLADRGKHRVHVIGFRVRSAFFEPQSRNPNHFFPAESAARCLADQTGGIYTGVENLEELVAALRETLGCPLFSAVSVPRLKI